MKTIFFIILIGGTFMLWVQLIIRVHSRQGTITLKNGRSYPYRMGDNLVWYNGPANLRGIDVELPKELPHVYLDSRKGGGRQARFVLDPAQRIQLEGDFNQYYDVYVPPSYKVLALSLLTPDVMQALIGVAGEYDIEIFGSHVRVIARRRVFKNAARQKELVHIATRVLMEVDHRLQSWSKDDSLNARNQDLRLFPLRGVRLGRVYIRWQFIVLEAFWLLILLLCLVVAVQLYTDPYGDRTGALTMLIIGFSFFLIFSALTIVAISRSAVRSRHG